MHIALLGGTGNLGRHILDLALHQGHHITALVRDPTRLHTRNPNLRAVQGDALNEQDVRAILPDVTAVISTLGSNRPGAMETAARNIVAGMQHAGVRRAVVVNAAGILQHNDRQLILERPTFPIFLRGVARAHLSVWRAFEQSDLDWTLVCPPRMIDRPTRNAMQVRPDVLPEGGGSVSLSDVARLTLSELTDCSYMHRRVGVNA